jgi:hypothetical protein
MRGFNDQTLTVSSDRAQGKNGSGFRRKLSRLESRCALEFTHQPRWSSVLAGHHRTLASEYAYSNVVPDGRAMNRPGPSGSSSPQ